MKEIFFISSYTPTSIQEEWLFNLIKKLKSENKTIFLTSRSLLPQDIIKQCDYYIFDCENKILDDYKYQCWSFLTLGNNKFEFIDLLSNIHLLPVEKSFLSGLSFIKSLKYDIVHYVEYDQIIKDISLFNDNYNDLISGKNDLIFYKIYGHENKESLSAPFSFNLNKIDFSKLVYDEKEIINKYFDIIKKGKFPFIESLSIEILFKDFNILIKNKDILENKLEYNLSLQLIKDTGYQNIHIHNNTVHFIHKNNNLKTYSSNFFDIICETIQGNLIPFSFSVDYNQVYWENFNIKFEDVKSIKIYKNNNLIKFFDFINSKKDQNYIKYFSKVTSL